MEHTQAALEAIYSKSPKKGELSALDRLMSDEVLDAIKADEESSLRHEKHFDQRVYVDMVWIDKIPLAEFCSQVFDCNNRKINSKVEIGDLLIQRTHSQVQSLRSVLTISNRSLVVQAKITQKYPVIVPISSVNSKKVTSTTKELALLENWPKLNLFETSGSKSPILKGLDIDEAKPHSFYGGFNTLKQEWLFGAAKKGQHCDLMFGDLLAGLRDSRLGETANGHGAWPELMAGIMRAAKNRKIPNYINSTLRNRVQSRQASIAGFDLSALYDCIRPRRMAVLMIDQIDFEGHEIAAIQSAFPR